jgi:hypothetical protein
MDLLAHAVPQRGIHDLVSLHATLAPKNAAHDDGFEMLPVSCHAQMVARNTRLDVSLQLVRRDHIEPLFWIRNRFASVVLASQTRSL